ncbi:ABC transporter permease [Mycoplasma todarodis]|uniref:ABC transporter permease n=1 Tax=Mycoplasma todarodis TaxID=1937191 RepID=UPI003B3714FB
MRATFKLLNAYFWKTYYGPILVFIFPTLLLTIMGNVMRIEYVFPGILAMVTLFIGIQVMPLGIMELKGSTLFKYIGSTPVNPKRFVGAVILYYVLLNILALLIIIVLGGAIFYKDVFAGSGEKFIASGIKHGLYSGIFSAKGFFSFIFANLLHIVMTLAIGLAIATFSKTPQQALTIGLIVVLPSMFLSGMVITVDVIARSTVMQWLSRLIIFRYTTANIVISSTPSYQLGGIVDHLVQGIDGDKKAYLDLVFKSNSYFIHEGKVYVDINNVGGVNSNTWLPPVNDVNYKPGHHYVSIDTIHDLLINNRLSEKSKKMIFLGGDATLFMQVFTNETLNVSSDNGIFQFNKNWGVRRIPDVELIKQFIMTYFKGENGKGGDTKRFIEIYDKYISQGKFTWLDMFMNQSILLYTKAERVLNLVLPTLVAVGSAGFAIKRFRWSAR